MKVQPQSLKPYWPVEGHFINIPDAPTFDPKHPAAYPGQEVVIKETLSPQEFLTKYGKEALFDDTILYAQTGPVVFVLELTGRTSADVLEEAR